MTRLIAPLLVLGLLSACSTHHAISGTVTDRNGEPLDRVIVTVAPGNVQLVTDQEGYFQVDYLRDEDGERVRMRKREDYNIEAFKPGYHVEDRAVAYKRGELLMDPITLAEDSVRVVPTEQNLDPDANPDRAQGSGAAYEGE